MKGWLVVLGYIIGVADDHFTSGLSLLDVRFWIGNVVIMGVLILIARDEWRSRRIP